ncbi:MAG: 4-hydroxy-tetrahydrodipicolinate synthase [Sphaerochaetaceae bacterium]
MHIKPKGVLPAMITPLTKDGQIHEKALRKLIEFLIAGGVHGIFAIGTTGEFYCLSNDEYREILEITKDQVGGRVPVYAGANHITTRGSIELAQIAQDVGVDVLSVLTPLFINPNQNQLIKHFTDIANNTDLPMLLYDNRPKTHVALQPSSVAELAKVKNIIGIKDSSGDMTNTAECIRLTKGMDFSVMIGRDTLIHANLCYGGSGAVAACANVAPRICADIYDKYISGDIGGSLESQYRLAPLRIAFSLGTFPTVIKEALEILGIPAGPCFDPVGPMSSEEKEQLIKILKTMELI